MALIPLKQRATVITPGELDDWGEYTGGTEKVYKVRVDNSIKTLENRAGEEVVTTAQVWFDKYPEITYESTIVYEDEWGNKIRRQPELIEPLRMINGKPTLTIVHLR